MSGSGASASVTTHSIKLLKLSPKRRPFHLRPQRSRIIHQILHHRLTRAQLPARNLKRARKWFGDWSTRKVHDARMRNTLLIEGDHARIDRTPQTLAFCQLQGKAAADHVGCRIGFEERVKAESIIAKRVREKSAAGGVVDSTTYGD